LSFSDESSVSGDHLYSILNVPDMSTSGVSGTFSLKDTFKFYYLDLLFGYQLVNCSCFQLDVLGGLQYGYLDFDEEFVSVGVAPIVVRNHSKLCGVGPEVGFEFAYSLFNCLTFTGRGDAVLLISSRESSFSNIPNGMTTLQTENESYCAVIPTADLRFGLSYEVEYSPACMWGSLLFDFEVGYEVITYFDGLNRTHYSDSEHMGSSFDELINFSLHGPYIHFGCKF